MMREETLFHLALAQAAEERAAFLEQVCEGDAELRQRVEVLLQAHANPGSFLKKPALDFDATTPPPLGAAPDETDSGGAKGAAPGPERGVEGVGSRIGPYHLLQRIGEGGMGAVFLAEQTQP